jgi:hypothetical protein
MEPKDYANIVAKVCSELAKEVYGDTLKPGMQAIGNVLELVNLPLACVAGRGKIWLKHHLENYDRKMAQIPADKVVSVAPEIGVPILQNLSYYTDEALSELFVNLLASASVQDTVHLAHPGFIRDIEHLSPDEGRLLLWFRKSDVLAWVDLVKLRDMQPKVSQPGYVYFSTGESLGLDYPQNLGVYEANLEGLGLMTVLDLEIDYRETVSEIHMRLANELNVEVDRRILPSCFHYLRITAYGRMFVDACTREVE